MCLPTFSAADDRELIQNRRLFGVLFLPFLGLSFDFRIVFHFGPQFTIPRG